MRKHLLTKPIVEAVTVRYRKADDILDKSVGNLAIPPREAYFFELAIIPVCRYSLVLISSLIL